MANLFEYTPETQSVSPTTQASINVTPDTRAYDAAKQLQNIVKSAAQAYTVHDQIETNKLTWDTEDKKTALIANMNQKLTENAVLFENNLKKVGADKEKLENLKTSYLKTTQGLYNSLPPEVQKTMRAYFGNLQLNAARKASSLEYRIDKKNFLDDVSSQAPAILNAANQGHFDIAKQTVKNLYDFGENKLLLTKGQIGKAIVNSLGNSIIASFNPDDIEKAQNNGDYSIVLKAKEALKTLEKVNPFWKKDIQPYLAKVGTLKGAFDASVRKRLSEAVQAQDPNMLAKYIQIGIKNKAINKDDVEYFKARFLAKSQNPTTVAKQNAAQLWQETQGKVNLNFYDGTTVSTFLKRIAKPELTANLIKYLNGDSSPAALLKYHARNNPKFFGAILKGAASDLIGKVRGILEDYKGQERLTKLAQVDQQFSRLESLNNRAITGQDRVVLDVTKLATKGFIPKSVYKNLMDHYSSGELQLTPISWNNKKHKSELEEIKKLPNDTRFEALDDYSALVKSGVEKEKAKDIVVGAFEPQEFESVNGNTVKISTRARLMFNASDNDIGNLPLVISEMKGIPDAYKQALVKMTNSGDLVITTTRDGLLHFSDGTNDIVIPLTPQQRASLSRPLTLYGKPNNYNEQKKSEVPPQKENTTQNGNATQLNNIHLFSY